MNKDQNKGLLLAILIIGVITMTVAFATLSQRLDITSTAVVESKSTNWNVHFSNLSCTPSGYAAITTPFDTSDTTKLDGLVATFKAPGDKVTCTFDVTNSGTIDAKITAYAKQDAQKTISCTSASLDSTQKAADETLVCNKLNYSLTYDETGNTNEPAVNDTLTHATSRHMKLVLELDSSLNDLPSSDVTISNLSTYIIYGQN